MDCEIDRDLMRANDTGHHSVSQKKMSNNRYCTCSDWERCVVNTSSTEMCETPRLAIENHDDLDVWTDFAPDSEDVERNDVCFAHAWAAPLQTVWKDMRSRTTCEPGSPCDEGVAQLSEKTRNECAQKRLRGISCTN